MDDELALDAEDGAEGEVEGDGPVTSGSGLPWDGSDRDYIYEELLGKPRICCTTPTCRA